MSKELCLFFPFLTAFLCCLLCQASQHRAGNRRSEEMFHFTFSMQKKGGNNRYLSVTSTQVALLPSAFVHSFIFRLNSPSNAPTALLSLSFSFPTRFASSVASFLIRHISSHILRRWDSDFIPRQSQSEEGKIALHWTRQRLRLRQHRLNKGSQLSFFYWG